MERVEELMATRRWQGWCLRYSIAPPDKIQMWKKTKLAMVESNSPKTTRHDRALVQAIKDIAPEWWDDTRICLNRNVKCEKHKDSNKGYSYLLWLGDFTGGALVFDDGSRIEGTDKYIFHKINGQIPHWNEDHEGTKYSIIIYKGGGLKKKTDIIKIRSSAQKQLRET